MKLQGFFDDVFKTGATAKQYLAEIEARYQSRIAEFMQLKEELYTLRSILNNQGVRKDADLAATYSQRCNALIDDQLALEQSSVNVISTLTGMKGSDIYKRVMQPSGNALDDAAYIVQAAQLVRDAGALLSNWNTVNNEMSAHVSAVQTFSDMVREWLGLPKTMFSAFPWNALILPAGIIAAGLAVLGLGIGRAKGKKK